MRALAIMIPLGLAGCLTGCLSSGPETLPRTEASTAEIVSSIRARNAGFSSLSAVVAMVYESPDREGTFTAVVLYEAPQRLRIQAFKDLVVDSRDLFDLLLRPEGYFVRHELDSEPAETRGPLDRFPSDNPRFSGIYWAREALLLPGAAHPEHPIEVQAHLASGIRIETRLASGVRAQWDLDPVTLRPLRGVVFAPNRRIHLEYLDYKGRGGPLDFPEEVRFRDGATSIQVRLSDLEVDAELDPDAFRLP